MALLPEGEILAVDLEKALDWTKLKRGRFEEAVARWRLEKGGS